MESNRTEYNKIYVKYKFNQLKKPNLNIAFNQR